MSPNVAGLPPEFIKRFKEALAPVCETRDERRLLLAEAFGTGPMSEAIRSIDRDLTAPLFAVDCCVKLSSEPVDDAIHPLAAILRVVGERRGAEAVRELGALIEFCNGLLPAPVVSDIPSVRSVLERDYLERLRLEDLINTDKYTKLAGNARTRSSAAPGTQSVVARPEFEHFAQRSPGAEFGQPRRFEDAVTELLAIHRAAVVGEPGAGKTTVLWKIARELVDAALNDGEKPIPLLVKLGEWTEPDKPLRTFIADQLDGLGQHLDTLLAEGRAALLFDGLNEIPVAQRKHKVALVRTFLQAAPQRDLIAIVTCREQDYEGQDLGLDRVSILPLDAWRILGFAQESLGPEEGETFFWTLAGNVKPIWEKWRKVSASLDLFFTAADIPRNNPDVFSSTSGAEDEAWRKHIRAPGTLIKLADNPYMLSMLIRVYLRNKRLPANRASLFAEFVEVLLLREHLADEEKRSRVVTLPENAARLLDRLAGLAYAMQRSVVSAIEKPDRDDDTTATTAISLGEADRYLDGTELYLAASASFITLGDHIRFTHQLLQEYFAARKMLAEIEAGRLRAADLWPPATWWQRSGWEEAAVLLTGMVDNCAPMLRWLAEANPEVAARCVLDSGANVLDSTLLELRAVWVPRLTDLKRDPNPRARAAVGRALGLLTLKNGETLDNRPGVRAILGADRDHVPTPEIDWVPIEGGDFIYQQETRKVGSFRIARYPVTNAQFQAFIDASDGWSNLRWWKGLSGDYQAQPGTQWFNYWNHPRDNVSWYDAVAFCRWLSARQGFEVRLPTEFEWERAACGVKGREYAYPGPHNPANANTNMSIGLTTATGIYPNGATPQPEGVLDLTGNVWEWCLNEYSNPKRTTLSSYDDRSLRGGAWNVNPVDARAAHRDRSVPNSRYYYLGFRLVCSPVSRL